MHVDFTFGCAIIGGQNMKEQSAELFQVAKSLVAVSRWN